MINDIFDNQLKNPQFLSMTPNAEVKRELVQTTKSSLMGSHARFKSIDLNIVDSIVNRSYRSTSQQPEVDQTQISTNAAKYIDKVFEQLKTQASKAKLIFKQDFVDQPAQFKTLKDALKFSIFFNQKLLTSLQENKDQGKRLQEQAKLIEELSMKQPEQVDEVTA